MRDAPSSSHDVYFQFRRSLFNTATLSDYLCNALPASWQKEPGEKEGGELLYVKVSFTTGGDIAFSRATREKTTKSTGRVKKVGRARVVL